MSVVLMSLTPEWWIWLRSVADMMNSCILMHLEVQTSVTPLIELVYRPFS